MTKNQEIQQNKLTEGVILPAIMKLALPIMGASFIQMSYNLVDMIWLGKIGGTAVASAGTAGFFVWLAFSLIIIAKVGTEVGIAQATGRGENKESSKFAQNGIQLAIIFSIIYSVFIYYYSEELIQFFKLPNKQVVDDAISYLKIVNFGLLFTFLNPIFSGIYNGSGNSKSPFYISLFGMLFNAVLDPFLIYGVGGFPQFGVKGAAIVTVLSQGFVVILFIFYMKFGKEKIPKFSILKKIDFRIMRKIIKIGYPVGFQSGLFTVFSIVLARIVAQWGSIPIAIQKVGAQIEAISWTTAQGFASALSAFIGQNFGAQKWNRIGKGFFITIGVVTVFGIFTSLLFIFFGKYLFMLFITEPESLAMGTIYLRILGYSQLFMIIEITTAGGFNGLGKTIPPSLISIIFTGSRIPLALLLSSELLLGLEGVWWSISLSSIFKGIILFVWFIYLLKHHPKICNDLNLKQKIFRWDFKFLRDKRSIK